MVPMKATDQHNPYGSSFKRLKVITSHAGLARFYAECVQLDGCAAIIAWLARCQVEEIPSPYRSSPTVAIGLWNGKRVVVFETRHRHYEIFEVPANFLTFPDEEQATDWDARYRRKDHYERRVQP
jgi:hypothetical protein